MTDPSIPAFRPRGLLAHRHVQSVLTSGPWRRRSIRRAARDYLRRSQPRVIEAADGTRLLGFANRALDNRRDALVILLHGWEGSVDSNYLLGTARVLDAAGFDTFRLNFRDHGDSHHLNVDLFHSCRLDEVLDAVAQVQAGYQAGPVFLAGFSLGGNFALRIARHAPARGVELHRVMAVCPVIRPRHVLDSLESGMPLYQGYFVRKWRRSLRIKQALYPERYDLAEWFRLRDLRSQTDWLVEHLTEFSNLDAYLEGYSVAGDYLLGLDTETLVVTAEDDPIIPISDFHALPEIDAMDLEVLPHGGHCGFLANWRLESWIELRVVEEFRRYMVR
ncbi:alpha/beta fold hydrolase [Wenzhouxiangella sp. AB-CW3]|uniref:YheT family hydrolase n=1 Tax=Wenzhouxiangella sp. AB-CW3 TaxID=2771012 RepID=UPI00168AD5D6|nr:alpha/beta fold hydrolase [Wenzhouxiangella sp. AB-CW3]QOC21783.1 alpha/beta fold hydrolase [Wenzhouxiangella sp. AB-CW3]